MTFLVPSVKMGMIKLVTLKGDEGAWFGVYYIATAVVVILLVKRLLLWRVNLPPGPPGLPFIGHMHLLGANPHRSLAEMAQKHGPLMFIRLGSKPYVICSAPETAKEFLKMQDANFGSRPYMSQGQHLMYGRQDVAFQASTPEWRNLKKIFTMELTSGASLEASRHIRVDEVACMIRGIREQKSVELKSQLMAMISNVVSRMVLNKRFVGVADPNSSQIEKDFPDMVQTFFVLAGLFVPGDFIPALRWLDLGGCEAKMKKHKLRMDAFVSDILSQHRQRRRDGLVPPEERDYVHMLLDRMEMTDAASQLSEDNVKALILVQQPKLAQSNNADFTSSDDSGCVCENQDVFLAGNESMILTSEWAMAELLRKPALMAKAHAELDARVGRDRVVQESDLQNLPYLQAIVKEAFRLHPAGPLLLPRESSLATQAFGYDLPAKTRVITNVWAIGRDPSIWPEPELFNPDRFQQPNLLRVDVRGQHFELLPFGAGRRICPAVTMGTMMVQFVVASLLHSFDWSLPAHISPDTLDMSELFGLTLPRAAPLPCIATPRLSPQCY